MASVTYTQQEVTESLVALVAFAGNATEAGKALRDQGKRCPSSGTLTAWAKDKYVEEYEKIRERHGDQIEKKAVHDLREIVALAHEAQRLAIAKTIENLKNDKDKDPSRTAANMATVADKMTRDSLTMQGKPTSIREDRDLEGTLRSLFASGVLKAPAEITSGDTSS